MGGNYSSWTDFNGIEGISLLTWRAALTVQSANDPPYIVSTINTHFHPHATALFDFFTTSGTYS